MDLKFTGNIIKKRNLEQEQMEKPILLMILPQGKRFWLKLRTIELNNLKLFVFG